ncbi:ABC transporter substrate-binding protein [Bradyrhizobium sp. AZCC 2289]|uniref:ABC transporter substrate-binding protein n=1 Tax=Bradyrhizobium sp. AZCC 2289 TaxID=3117026 RepID=UPI002FEE8D8C
MRRRDFITVLGAAAALPFAARAQPAAKIPRIGLLVNGSLEQPDVRVGFDIVRQAFAELGYVAGKNIVFEPRGTDGTIDQLPAAASELVGLKVDVIVAMATPAGRAAQHATSTIPIVVGSMGDPVQDGLVASLSRPGGNLTGTTFLGPELVPKRLALLKELMPSISKIAVLWHPGAFSEQTTSGMLKQVTDTADSRDLRLQLAEVRSPDEFERAFSDMANAHADALFEFPSPMFYQERKRLVDLAAKYRLPAMYNAREFVEVGGLISYGANIPDLNRRTATYVDKILKGAKPSDIPVEQPTKFELAVNRTTAKALGIDVPPALLATADAVIE